MGKRTWTEDQLRYLKENYEKGNKEEIIEVLGKTWCSVKHKGQLMGLERKHKTLLENRSELEVYLINKEDGNLAFASPSMIDVICPNCGYKKKIRIRDFSRQGFGCQVCSDGISMPEKIMSEVLFQSGVIFEREKRFSWSKNKRYDFYIPSLKIIIETHGKQHYIDTNRSKVCDVFKNDIEKYELTKDKKEVENYITIDCRESNIDFILKNIKESSIGKQICWESVDRKRIFGRVSSSYIIECGNMFKSGLSVVQIAEKMSMNRCTITEWLKICTGLGICDYNPVRLVDKVKNYDEILEEYKQGFKFTEIANKYDLHVDTIRKFIKREAQKGNCEYNAEENRKNSRSKKVRNNINNSIYESATDASLFTGISGTTMRRYCNDENNKEWEYIS